MHPDNNGAGIGMRGEVGLQPLELIVVHLRKEDVAESRIGIERAERIERDEVESLLVEAIPGMNSELRHSRAVKLLKQLFPGVIGRILLKDRRTAKVFPLTMNIDSETGVQQRGGALGTFLFQAGILRLGCRLENPLKA